jgi:hypothetical protein
MSPKLFIYVEHKTSKGWELPLGMINNPDFDTTCSHYLSRRCPKDLFSSTNKALGAILGYSDKRFCSTTDFESVKMQPGLPADHTDNILERFPYGSLGASSEAWWIAPDDLKAFPFHTKTIVREGYVSPEIAQHFTSTTSEPLRKWPDEIPVAFSDASSQGVLVKWMETYADAMGEKFFEALKQLDGLNGEIRLVCIVE